MNPLALALERILVPAGVLLALAAVPGTASAATQVPRTRHEAPPQRDALSEAVDRLGEDAVRTGASELVLAVDVRGTRVVSRGFGARRCAGPPDGETRFHAGPFLPAFLSVAALSLAEQDRLDLDASLSEHLPQLPQGGLGVRVDQLLTHTSGIPGYGPLLGSDRRTSAEADAERILAWLENGPLESQPGTCASYSNTNDFLLGLVLERVGEKSVAELLEELVFARAGMDDTGFVRAASPPAAPVEQEFAGLLEDQEGAPAPFAAETLYSTAHDLLRFQHALTDHRLLSEASLELRAAPPRLAGGVSSHHARGISLTQLDDASCHSAGGGMAGERAHLDYYPALDTTVVVWARGEDAPVQQIAARLARTLFDLEQPEVRDLATTVEMRLRHVGDYYAGCTSHDIVDEEEHLVLYPPDGPRTVLLYQGGESFVARDDPDVRLEFESESETGAIVAFVLTQHGVSLRARRLY